MTRFILLMGKIGAGKSYVAAMLRNKHYIVLDTDKVAKDRMEQDPSLYRTIVNYPQPKGCELRVFASTESLVLTQQNREA